MRWTTKRQRRITSIVALVAALTASAFLTAGFGSAAQNAPERAAYTCPPAC
jgi:hypothetical protein